MPSPFDSLNCSDIARFFTFVADLIAIRAEIIVTRIYCLTVGKKREVPVAWSTVVREGAKPRIAGEVAGQKIDVPPS